MREFDNETIDALLGSLMVSMSDTEKEMLKAESARFFALNDLLEHVDTTGVKPMSYPFEAQEGVLRQDHDISTLPRDLALKNAPRKHEGYVETVQVVQK